MKIKKELILRQIAGDTILVPVGKTVIDNNGLFIMNEVSADIWEMICQGMDQPRITQKIAELYDAPIEVIRPDVDEFLQKLVRYGIVEL